LITLVLSGAANYGAMQAGAIEALLSCGYQPEMIIGTSAGALNAIFIASNPTVDGARHLGALWEAFGASQAVRFSRLTSVRQLLTRKNSLIPNESLVNFLQAQVPLQAKTFGRLMQESGIRTYTIAVRMEDGQVVAFGDQDNDRLIDGAMASISIPPLFEPWKVDGHQYLDGGIAANLPLSESIERGATQIVALTVDRSIGQSPMGLDMLGLGRYAIAMMVNRQTDLQLDLVYFQSSVFHTFLRDYVFGSFPITGNDCSPIAPQAKPIHQVVDREYHDLCPRSKQLHYSRITPCLQKMRTIPDKSQHTHLWNRKLRAHFPLGIFDLA